MRCSEQTEQKRKREEIVSYKDVGSKENRVKEEKWRKKNSKQEVKKERTESNTFLHQRR